MNNILTEFNSSGLEFDRIVTDRFVLPHDLTQVLLQPNELVTDNTINMKLQKLYNNMLYIYGLCNIANFNIPKLYSGWVGVSGTNTQVNFYTTSTAGASSFNVDSSYAGLNNSFYATSFFYRNKNNMVVANSKNLTLFSIEKNNQPIFVKSQSLIDPLSGTLFFQNIASIGTDGSKLLYVLDKTLNTVYQYDLESVFSDDYVFSQRLFLQDSVGGTGDRYDLLKFNSPNNLVVTANEVIVEDTGNKVFKVYDKNLNFLSLTVALTLFREVTGGFNSLTYDTESKNIIATANKKIYFLDYRSDYSIVSSFSYDFNKILDNDENIIDIKFANYESNIFYMLTNKRLFKKWKYKLNNNIGVYSNSTLNYPGFVWVTTTQSSASADQICVYGTKSIGSNSQQFVAVLEDELNLTSLLHNKEFNIYDFNDIKIKPDEYVQSWVFNKSFKKLTYNMYLLTSYIIYRFYQGINEDGTPVFLKRGYNNFVVKSNNQDVNTLAMVCVNENFQTSVVNRCLTNLYNYQLSMLQNVVSNEVVNEILVEFGPGGSADFNFITYTAGNEFTLVPEPTGPMLYSSDSLISPLDDMTVQGSVPYTGGAGISITEV